jgi:peptidoglycan DL-endopeptidase CwlO
MTNIHLVVTLTAYCSCAKCCGRAGEKTASGYYPQVGITIAAPRNIPFGTKLYIPELSLSRTVYDRTALKYDGRWDLFVSSHKEARKFGKKKVKLIYVTK